MMDKIYQYGVGIPLSIFSRYPIGTNVFDKEWDILLILDTCRLDALRSMDEFEFLGDIGSIWSLGTTSSEWIAQTFTQERVTQERIGYTSGNAWSKWVIEDRQMPEDDKNALFSFTKWDVAHKSEFAILDQAWKYDQMNEFNLPPGLPHPRIVTNHAIQTGRTYDLDRHIIHYSQPHAPYTAPALADNRNMREYERSPFDYLRNGGHFKKVWDAYLQNLRFVLDEVELLLDNINAETVSISADHGELFGEFGIYGHPAGFPHPSVKRVPWAETSATDKRTHEIDTDDEEAISATEQLEALGYI